MPIKTNAKDVLNLRETSKIINTCIPKLSWDVYVVGKNYDLRLDKNGCLFITNELHPFAKENLKSELTFVGVKSAEIKNFEKKDNIYIFTVDFVSEIITCKKDKNNKVIEGNPDIIKTVNDIWKFSKNMWSNNPNWYLVETQA